MSAPNLIVLYVESAAASAAFYKRLIGTDPVAASENFVALPLAGGFTLGLWSKSSVMPPAGDGGARSEIGIMVESPAAIEALFTAWTAEGVAIEQPLTTLDFGPTFVARDPDGHRIRVCLLDS